MTPEDRMLPGYFAEELERIQYDAAKAGDGIENPAPLVLQSLSDGITRLLAKARRAERVRIARAFAESTGPGVNIDAKEQAALESVGVWNLLPGCLALAGKALTGKDGDWTVTERTNP